MQADAVTFVKMFVNGIDNIGLVTFTGAPFVPDPFTPGVVNSLPQIEADINSLQVPNNSMTNTAAAMSTAYAQLQTLNQPAALNVVVLFTAGLAGAFTGNFAGLVTNSLICSPATNPLYGVLYSDQGQTEVGGLADFVSQSINDTPEAARRCWLYELPRALHNPLPFPEQHAERGLLRSFHQWRVRASRFDQHRFL